LEYVLSSTRKKHKVFVYGTLRPKGVEATHSIDGWLLYNYHGRFPYILPGSGVVHGNIVEVTDKQLREFDHIEGIAHGLFIRQTVRAFARSHAAADDCEAFVYVAGNLVPQPIQSGDWFNR
jgi:gamma-glutamylcyclotransferase (GGCT)/AIG2-like uncharacterized protein YtfP